MTPAERPGAPWPAARVAWGSVIVLTLVYSIAFVHRIGLGLLVEPLQKDLHFSDTAIGWLAGIFFALPYTLGGPIFGWIADRRSRRSLIAMAALGWSATTAAFGLLTSYTALAAARIAAGLTQSALQPAASSMIADCFQARDRSRAFGVYIAGTAFGTALSYWLGAVAIGLGAWIAAHAGLKDWSAAFLALALIGLIAPLAMALVREPVRRERAGEAATSVRATLGFIRREWLVVGSLSLGVAICFLAPYGQLAFMPVMFSRKYGWSAAELALVYGVIAVFAGGFGSMLGGWISARLARRGRADSDWIICTAGSAGSLVTGGLAPLMPTAQWSLFFFTLSAIFTNWPSVGALGAVNRLAPNEMRGQLTSVYTSCAGLIGAGLGPVVIGTLSDRLPAAWGGVSTAMSMTFFACAVLSCALLVMGHAPFARLASRVYPTPNPRD
ncbi:MAG: MFS transporter [Steroidobacteraceae bacterium]|nr:MFS transporter [Steroidobacteraceae bacterium]